MAIQLLSEGSARQLAPGVPTLRPVDEYYLGRHGRLVSASRPLSDMPAERFLQAAEGQERFFWRDGQRGIAFAGMGVAACLIGYGQSRFSAIRRQASELFAQANLPVGQPPLARPRLFGGFAFRPEFTPDVVWTGFHPAHFILPHYQLVILNAQHARAGGTKAGETPARTGEQSWLTINALLPPEEEPAANLHMLQEALNTRIELLRQVGVERREKGAAPSARGAGDEKTPRVEVDYPLPYREWAQMVRTAQQAFATTPLQKVVLSRIAQLRATRPLRILPALTDLCARYPDCFSFLFEPQPGHAFLGATPELLVRVQEQQLETMALAGSIQRGSTAQEDAYLASALLASAKDRHEHRLVVDALRRRLQPLTSQLHIPDEPTVLTLSNIQHLYTPVSGALKRQDGVLPQVEALHPTPALGGSPRDLALAFIQAHEPTLRGWYAAPVGWIDSSLEGAFAGAIRSAVVQKQRAWAYAGAGIVAGSIPQKEWEETEWKFQPIMQALHPVHPESCKS